MARNDHSPFTLSATDMNWNYYFTNEYDVNFSAAFIGDLVILSLSAIICAFGVIANGMVGYYLGFRIRRTPFTVYILNLAIADFIFLIIFSFSLVYMIFLEDIEFEIYSMSDILEGLFMFGYATSQYFLTAISVERSLSILFPIWYQCRRPKKQSAIVCIALWVLSGVTFLTYFLSCIHYKSCTAISIIQGVIGFLILLPLMILSNVVLVTLICRRSKKQHPPRLYILIITTVVAFLVLSLPLSLMIFLDEFDIGLQGYTTTAFVSPGINSSLNPVIYFLVGSLRQRQRKCSIIAPLRRAFVEETESTQQ